MSLFRTLLLWFFFGFGKSKKNSRIESLFLTFKIGAFFGLLPKPKNQKKPQ
jgi:hypothetical protein